MLLVQIHESGYGDIHLITAPYKVSLILRLFICYSFSQLVVFNGIFDGVWDALEGFLVIIPQHTLFHEFNAVDRLQLTWRYLDRQINDRYHKPFHCALFFVF